MSHRGQEQVWIGWLRTLPDPLPALRAFSASYHFFSLHQVLAFARLFPLIPAADRRSLAMLADVLHEELGRNDPERVHSVLFERFAQAVGLSPASLPRPEAEVAPGVVAYVRELEDAFGGPSLPRALATYQFLESSAVETYGPLLETLRAFGLAERDLEFFALHAEVEVEHARAAQEMVDRQCFTAVEAELFERQKECLAGLWDRFWADIAEAGRQALDGRQALAS